MDTGTIVYLNGTSSSGKHSIVRALQDLMDEPWFSTGIDVWVTNYAPRFRTTGSRAAEGLLWEFGAGGQMVGSRTGPYGKRLFRGLYAAVAALAATGNNVVVDDVMFEDWMIGACARALAESRAYFVGIHCRLEIAEARERERGDRPLGMAASCHGLVHRGAVYDMELDSSETSALKSARVIRSFLAENHPPRAFRLLAA